MSERLNSKNAHEFENILVFGLSFALVSVALNCMNSTSVCDLSELKSLMSYICYNTDLEIMQNTNVKNFLFVVSQLCLKCFNI